MPDRLDVRNEGTDPVLNPVEIAYLLFLDKFPKPEQTPLI
jgi:hypothetical protein